MKYPHTFGCIVVGGGHAGTEAALAAARSGVRTLLLTQSLETLGQMSCNPAIGGIGKGHLTKEIDALGGAMATAIDRAGIHFRILNASKGPAVRATRAQADRLLYKRAIRELLDAEPNLTLLQQAVDGLLLDGERVRGVVTQAGMRIEAATVVLTVGTFLDGKIHVGQVNYAGGRAGDPASVGLAHTLRELGLTVGRLKTGTPPRIDGRTVDYARLPTQPGDEPVPVFSFLGRRAEHPRQVPCHITHTTEARTRSSAHGLDRSPLYTGAIEGVGPRYCPSIEDKIVRFADRTRHQIFIEPEGLDDARDLPERHLDVAAVRRAARARALDPGLRARARHAPRLRDRVRLLRSARSQGHAGDEGGRRVCTSRGRSTARRATRRPRRKAWSPASTRRSRVRGRAPWCAAPRRGLHRRADRRPHHARHDEPYRMFTSRAEYRLLLREDNADLRLTPVGRDLGVVADARWQTFETRRERLARETQRLRDVVVRPTDVPDTHPLGPLTRDSSAHGLLKRPDATYADVTALARVGESAAVAELPPEFKEQLVGSLTIEARYAGYIGRQNEEIERQKRQAATLLPDEFDYGEVRGLSTEVREKLERIRPRDLGQAARISGVTPAAVSLLLVHLKKQRRRIA